MQVIPQEMHLFSANIFVICIFLVQSGNPIKRQPLFVYSRECTIIKIAASRKNNCHHRETSGTRKRQKNVTKPLIKNETTNIGYNIAIHINGKVIWLQYA